MAGENVVKLKIGAEVFTIDMDDLELDELGTVEDLCGKSVANIDWFSARGMQGLVWIAMHRKNDRFSLADAGRIKFSTIEDKTDEEDDGKGERPTSAGRPRAKSGAATS